MRILMIHSKYREAGGEDKSALAEADLAADAGHDVRLLQLDNAELPASKLANAATAVWSQSSYKHIKSILRQSKFDVVHIQNYFPAGSPSMLLAASHMGVATVQALRNYRLLCVNASLFRDNQDCVECIGKQIPWPGVQHGCYRNSRSASLSVATMIGVHNALGTWSKHTDILVPVSEHVRSQFVRAGYDPKLLITKPNVAPAYSGTRIRSQKILYVGRLSPEKGAEVLIEAWLQKERNGILQIVGTGPQFERLQELARSSDSIVFEGAVDHTQVLDFMAESRAVAIPSLWEEPFGRTAIEAFSTGTPVISAARGGLKEIIGKSGAGILFEPRSMGQMSSAIDQALNNKSWFDLCSSRAYDAFASEYSHQSALLRVNNIYREAVRRRQARP